MKEARNRNNLFKRQPYYTKRQAQMLKTGKSNTRSANSNRTKSTNRTKPKKR